MTFNLPKIIGHRGACGYAPENTLESIYTAHDMGVKWIELDVKLTKDLVPIIFHDDQLDRTTNGSGAVASKDWTEIKQLEAGSWFGDSFAGVQIPSLEQALDAILELDLGLNLEIKPCPRREKETAEVALDLLSQCWDSENLIVSSFQAVCLDVALDMAPDYKRGLIFDEKWPDNWEDMIKHLEAFSVHINGNQCSREQVESLIDLEKPVLAYTINDPDSVRRLQGWGVDGFFTDVPDIVKESLLTVH